MRGPWYVASLLCPSGSEADRSCLQSTCEATGSPEGCHCRDCRITDPTGGCTIEVCGADTVGAPVSASTAAAEV
ncbi:hypothetical protein C8Q80DRAFT_1206297 [Daedaleopsis nitida]|nr:hypothetical protein C8Q80DRAFT_1206297 [Daedaleopsis nitida]